MTIHTRYTTIRTLIACVCLLALFDSCRFFDAQQDPFIISAPVCATGENLPWWHAAGITFDFLNLSDCDISRLTAECRLYDAETGENPFLGDNRIGVAFSGRIGAHSKESLAIPLDPYISAIPDTPFAIDRLEICTIEYADGSEWTNSEFSLLETITKGIIK